MKAVLISIQPKWCELIASGKKTVEVRKTKPKIETPFKCYIYCTQGNGYLESVNGKVQKLNYLELDLNVDNCVYELNGKVIGEFVCDRIDEIYQCNSGWVSENACISKDEFFDYLGIPRGTHMGYDKKAYAWHISDLVIYDKPKELSEFFYACDKPTGTDCSVCLDRRENKCKMIARPPQSWCYVEELR